MRAHAFVKVLSFYPPLQPGCQINMSRLQIYSGSVTETWFRIAIEEQVVLPQLFCEHFVCMQLHSKMNMPFLTKFRLFWKVE